MDHVSWAQEVFGAADLGDERLNRRLIQVVAAMAEKPRATVRKSLGTPAERTGAYRLLRNPKLNADKLEESRSEACVKQIKACGGDIIIPVDQTSFHLPDHAKTKNFGSVGNRSKSGRGVHVMTALAVSGRGTTLGVLRQIYWTRNETPGPARRADNPNKKERDDRDPDERESKYWSQIIEEVEELVRQCGPGVRPWLQCDRGADFHGVLRAMTRRDFLVTVRVYTNRVVYTADGERTYLLPWMDGLRVRGTQRIKTRDSNGRPGRKATLSIRYGCAEVELGPESGERERLPLYYVDAREENPPPGVEPLSWRLATNFPVRSLADAIRVLGNYRLRWRIEDLHFTLKGGGTDIERSQLHRFMRFRCWAILHSAMAARAERLRHRIRNDPDEPATVEFSRDEIDAAIRWRLKTTTRNRPPYGPGDTPTLGELILWVADLGGYTGPRTHPKPGTTPLALGLERLALFVEGIQLAKEFGLARSPPEEKSD